MKCCTVVCGKATRFVVAVSGIVHSHGCPVLIIPASIKAKLLPDSTGSVLALCGSDDGLIVCSDDYKRIHLIQWKEDSGKPKLELLDTYECDKKVICCMFLPGSNETLICGDKSGDVTQFNIVKNESGLLSIREDEEFAFCGRIAPILDLCVFSSGPSSSWRLALGDRDRMVVVHHYPNAYNIDRFYLGHTSYVTSVEANVEYLFTASGDGTVIIWEVTGEQAEVKRIQMDTDWIPVKLFWCSETTSLIVVSMNSNENEHTRISCYGVRSANDKTVSVDQRFVTEVEGHFCDAVRWQHDKFRVLTVSAGISRMFDLCLQNGESESSAIVFRTIEERSQFESSVKNYKGLDIKWLDRPAPNEAVVHRYLENKAKRISEKKLKTEKVS